MTGLSCACMHAQSPQSCLTLCNPMDYSLPGSSVHGILQARRLERVAISSSRDPDPGIKPASFMSLALADKFFTRPVIDQCKQGHKTGLEPEQ